MSQTIQITAKKRHRKDLDRERDFDSDSDIEIRSTASAAGVSGAWPRFLLVKVAKDGARLSPFLLEKWFEGVSRQIVNVKRQRDSSYLVDCPSKKVSDNLMARDGTSLNIGSETFGVSVSVHPSLNSSRGVARSYHFEGLSELEIKDGLASQGVTAVHKVLRTDKDGCKVRTNTVFLMFCTPVPPTGVKIMYENIHVSLFVPSPLRCFQCQRYGHSRRNCKNREICANCGKEAHGEQCQVDSHCVNCNGNHSAASKACPVWTKENEIQKIRSNEGCSFQDARKRYETRYPSAQPARSFATTVGSSMGDIPQASSSSSVVTALQQLKEQILKLSERMLDLENRLKVNSTQTVVANTVNSISPGSGNVTTTQKVAAKTDQTKPQVSSKYSSHKTPVIASKTIVKTSGGVKSPKTKSSEGRSTKDCPPAARGRPSSSLSSQRGSGPACSRQSSLESLGRSEVMGMEVMGGSGDA